MQYVVDFLDRAKKIYTVVTCSRIMDMASNLCRCIARGGDRRLSKEKGEQSTVFAKQIFCMVSGDDAL